MNRRHALKTLALGAASLPLVHGDLRADGAAGKPAVAATAATPAPVGPFTLPALGYAFDALEPHLDAETMRIHHDKHHAAYVNNLNKAVAGRKEVEGWSLERLMRDLASVPEDLRGAVRNQGGGHANHSLLWTTLAKGGTRAPAGELAKAIDAAFGTFDGFKTKFDAAAASVFGSGWAWLSADAQGVVRVETTPNQDSPLSAGRVPLLGIDVWEHAYYLKHQYRRPAYIDIWWNTVNWDKAAANFKKATA